MERLPWWTRPALSALSVVAAGFGVMIVLLGWAGTADTDAAACRASDGCAKAWLGAVVPGMLLAIGGVAGWWVAYRRLMQLRRIEDPTPDELAAMSPADRRFERRWQRHGSTARLRVALGVLGLSLGALLASGYADVLFGIR